MPFFDVHTHTQPKQLDTVCIRNAYHFLPKNIHPHVYYSVGIHPWQVHKYDVNSYQHLLLTLAKDKRVLAIGEIGLDKLKPHYNLQTSAFLVQTNLAKAAQLPIIVHCVKAYADLLPLLKTFELPVILHNFYASNELCQAFLKLPHVYFSLGKTFFLASGLNQTYAKKIPLDRIFLETDQSKLAVSERYIKASNFYEVGLEDLQKQIAQNALHVFKKLETL